MSLFFAGKITNVDNGTSLVTPIIGHMESNSSDHILYVCIRILFTFQHSVSSSSVIRHTVVGLAMALPPNIESLTTPPSSDHTVCVHWLSRTYQSLLCVPAFALTVGVTHSIRSSNPSAHRPWLLLSHNNLISTFGFGGNHTARTQDSRRKLDP